MSLRSQLREAQRQAYEQEMVRSSARDDFEHEKAVFEQKKADFEQKRVSSWREVIGLKRLLEATQQQLKLEIQLKRQVELDAANAKQGMEREFVTVCV